MERYEDGMIIERRLIVGAPTIVQDDPQPGLVHRTRLRAMGFVTSGMGVSVGLTRQEYFTFPQKCGAVFIEPDQETIDIIKTSLPDVDEICISD